MRTAFFTIASKSWSAARKSAGMLLILAVCSGVAYAGGGSSSGGHGGSSSGGSGGGVPEIDPTAVASSVTMLIGGVLMLTDRIRRK